MLIDEADSFLTGSDELRGVLNSGFEKSGSVVRVTEIQGEHQPVQFATFAPCALAAIGDLPSTLEDRAVPIRLQRKAATETVTKLRQAGVRAHLANLGRKLARWAADHGGALPTDPDIPAWMGDRQGDVSVALLCIADHAGGDWPVRARSALLSLFEGAEAAGSGTESGLMLLADIRDLFNEKGSHRTPSEELCKRLAEMENRPWPEWKMGKPITPPQLARALRPFGIKPVLYRPPGTDPVRGYLRDHFEDAWTRYLPANPPDG